MNIARAWLGAGVLTLVLPWAGCSSGVPSDEEATLRTHTQPLTITGNELVGRPTDTSVTVQMLADGPVEAYFEYGTTQGNYTDSTPPVTYSDGIIEAVITGLQANQQYYYRPRYRDAGTSDPFVTPADPQAPLPPRKFHTQRALGSTFKFDVMSDSHQGFAGFYSDALYGVTQTNIALDDADLLFDLGDTVSTDNGSGSTTNETPSSVFQKYLDQREFFSISGQSRAVFLVLGNHENEEGWNLNDAGSALENSLPVMGANGRKRYFLNPIPDGFFTGNLDASITQIDDDHLKEDYYAFEWGDALFVAIDPYWYTMKKPYGNGSAGGELDEPPSDLGNRWNWTLGIDQFLWLKQTLQNSSAKYKFVFAHQLVGGNEDYSRAGVEGAKYVEWGGYDTDGTTWGWDTNRPAVDGWGPDPIHKILVDNGASIFFHGHDHIFAKEDHPDGMVYQEMPHAANDDYGGGFNFNPTNYPNAVRINNSGHLRVTVTPTEATVEYVRAYLPGDEGINGNGFNRDVAYTYTVAPNGPCQSNSECDDGDLCTTDTCDAGDCNNAPVVCDDGQTCTVDACNPATGLCETPALDCDDQDPCTTDSCVEPGGCAHDPISNCTGPSARMETGTATVGATPITVDLAQEYFLPVVATSVRYVNNTLPVVPRVSNVTETSFDLRLQNPSGSSIASELVDYFVMEEGSWTFDDLSCEAQRVVSTVTDSDSSWVGEAQSYLGSYTSPAVFGQVMTENDTGWSVFWARGGAAVDPPNASTLFTGKLVGEDSSTTRADETLGFIVCETGTGQVMGTDFEVDVGPNNVAGVDDLPPYPYTFSPAFGGTPAVAVVTQAGMNGSNGSWAQLHGSPAVTATTLNLSIDEDQILDSERTHTTEEVAYAVFADNVVYPDACPADPNKTSPGQCGCGIADDDDDADGTANCNDGCPNDANKTAPGTCGCGVADVDGDADGTLDCNDGCPNDANKTAPGTCGCGVAETDSDSDGIPDCVDTCVGSCDCSGVVASISGQIEEVPIPPNLDIGVFVSADNIRLFNEGLGVVTAGMNEFTWDGGLYSGGQTTTPYAGPGLPAPGTEVCSVSLHYDGGVSGLPFNLETGVLQSGTITFDRDIIGVWVEYADLAASDGAFAPGTTFPPDDRRDLEFTYLGDEFSVDGTRRNLSITMYNHDGGFLDEVRVILAGASSGGGNSPPVALDDTASVESGSTVTIDVATNDSDVDLNLDPSTAAPISSPASGIASANGDGTIDYTANAGYSGEDSFAYQICDDLGACAAANVTVTVTAAPNGAPLEFVSTTARATPTTVALSNTYADPVVVCSAEYAANSSPIVVRVSNVGTSSFDVRLQNPSGGTVSAEAVSCLVVEAGSWTVDGVDLEAQKYLSTVTDGKNNWVGEAQTYLGSYTNPVVLGQVMSENDPNWSVFWSQGKSLSLPPSSTTLLTGKMIGQDPNTSRADEVVGFVVLEAGHGALAGVEYEAALGADTVTGVVNGVTTYDFTNPFGSAPLGAVVAMAGVDGGDGAWAQLNGPNPLSATQMLLSVDEDQVGDPERNHTTEQVAYVAFAPSLDNEAPTAVADSGVVDEDASIDLSVLTNDSDPDGDSLLVLAVSAASNGSTSTDGTLVSYTPDPDFCGSDAFSYTLSDGNGGSDVGTVDVTVTCINDFPVAFDDSASVVSGSTVTIDVAANDTDVELNLDPTTATPISSPVGGVASANGDGTIDYTANAGYSGEDSFTYQICDDLGSCATGNVTVTVTAEAAVAQLEFVTTTAGGTATTVPLSNTYADPVVVCSAEYAVNSIPIVVRVSNVGTSSFDVRLQNPSGEAVSTENVSCLVVEAGAWTVDGVNLEAQKYLSTVTDGKGSWVGQAQTYLGSYANPVVVGQVMSENDPNWSVFWSQGKSLSLPPSSTTLLTGKTVGQDPNTTRADEIVGFVVLEAGHGALAGVEYEATLGADTVRGVVSGVTTYDFSAPFGSAPVGAVVSMAGVDGGDGAWAQLNGPSSLSATQMLLSVDEDQVGDPERNHTTEQVAYVAFGSP